MVDPLAQVVSQLQPSLALSKLVSAAGRWEVQRAESGRPFYCAVLEGRVALVVGARAPVILEPGDFVLIPAASSFTASSLERPRGKSAHTVLPSGEVRHGDASAPPDVRMVVGYCALGSPDPDVLVSLLPSFVHVRGELRLTTLVELVGEEARARRPGREVILARLLEVLFIEALRANARSRPSPGLLRGLADEQLARALRRMHEQPGRTWTVAQLAKTAALSRSAFFERFTRVVGAAPMEYLLRWRMARAKELLVRGLSVGEVAEQVGYASPSSFSVAFSRHVGSAPKHFARARGA